MVDYESKDKDYSRDRKDLDEKPLLNSKGSLAKLIDLSKHADKILDVGCADGSLGQYLQDLGCHVTGIDISAEMLEVAKRYCDEVYIIDLEQSNVGDILNPNAFDVIICGDVLEHLRNPVKVLLQLKPLLIDNGFILASIPNISHGAIRLSLLQGKFDYQEFGILDSTHLRFFTRTSVIRLFHDAGYDAQIIDVTHCSIFGGNLVPSIDRSDFSEKLIQQVEASSDSKVLQFIIKATPISISANSCDQLNQEVDNETRESAHQEQYSEAYSDSLGVIAGLEKIGGTPENQLQEVKMRLQLVAIELQQTKAEYGQTQSKLNDSLVLCDNLQKELGNQKIQRQETEAKLASANIVIKDLQETVSRFQSTVMWKFSKRLDGFKEWLLRKK